MSDNNEIREKYRQFRILVIGRANAGKTTLLKRVCNTDEEPCIYDEENKNLVRYLSARRPVLTSSQLVGTNKRGTLFFLSQRVSCWLTLLTLCSVVFITSIVLSPSRATRNSCFMILLGLKVEISVSLRMFRTSLQSMQRQQKLRISFMLSGQFLNTTCWQLPFWLYPIGSVSHLILQDLFLDWRRGSSMRNGQGMVSYCSSAVFLAILTFLSSSDCHLH